MSPNTKAYARATIRLDDRRERESAVARMNNDQVSASAGARDASVQNGGILDFYATHPDDVCRLLAVEEFPGNVWEPACGTGEVAEVLRTQRKTRVLRCSDVLDRGYEGHEATVDFLDQASKSSVWGRQRVDHVVTNPPFRAGLAEAFLHRALEVANEKVALLVRLAWLEGDARRRTVFEATPLKRVLVFSRRPRFRPAGGDRFESGLIAFCWLVWEHGHEGPPTVGWLP